MMSKIPILIYNSFYQTMALGSAWCEIFALAGSISGIGAAITNAFIAYDRLESNEYWICPVKIELKIQISEHFLDTLLLRIHWMEN